MDALKKWWVLPEKSGAGEPVFCRSAAPGAIIQSPYRGEGAAPTGIPSGRDMSVIRRICVIYYHDVPCAAADLTWWVPVVQTLSRRSDIRGQIYLVSRAGQISLSLF